MDNKRIYFIDYAKTFAIFLVVLLHSQCDMVVALLIASFIMPSFFIISGFLFSYNRNPDYGSFAKKRFRQIIVPYLWMGLLTYCAWLFALRHFGSSQDSVVEWYIPLIGTITGTPPMLLHNLPLWSFLSFYIVEIAYYPLHKLTKSNIAIIFIAFVLAFLLSWQTFINESYLPFAIGPSITALGFYAIGNELRKRIKIGTIESIKTTYLVIVLIPLIAVFYTLARRNGYTDYYMCAYGNSFITFVATSILGSLSLLIISIIISRIRYGAKIFVRFSEGTLIVCGLHLLVFAIIKGGMLFVLRLNPAIATDGIANGITFSIITMSCLYPVIYVIRKYARPLVDK